MFETANVFDQIIPGVFRRSFRAKEFRAHIVVDPNDARFLLRESLYGLRADQLRRACNDNGAHFHGAQKFLGIDSADVLQNSCSFVPAAP